MASYNFSANALDFGNFEGFDQAAAQEAFANSAGYSSFAAMVEQAEEVGGGNSIEIREVLENGRLGGVLEVALHSSSTTPERLRQVIAENTQIDAAELQASIGQLVVATSADHPEAPADARSVHDPAAGTTTLLADRIRAGSEAQTLATEIARHHGQDAVYKLLGEGPEIGEYVELEVTLRSKTTFGTDKEIVRVWRGQSAREVADRTARDYGAEVLEIRNSDGSIFQEAESLSIDTRGSVKDGAPTDIQRADGKPSNSMIPNVQSMVDAFHSATRAIAWAEAGGDDPSGNELRACESAEENLLAVLHLLEPTIHALEKLVPHVLHYAGMRQAHSDAHRDAADARRVLKDHASLAAELIKLHGNASALKVPSGRTDELLSSDGALAEPDR